ncbi:hypothetical protein RHMOL_Rhmol08G0305200 [Rhododendron molle]|uniref:Uncharacterized protein n=1 Tax=Rhododendron molle TaxID=49168 RepID=A0ACC0MUG5_RHOML|nr:hypothetical protein RHMOL_Rhmol08G0305200 [Rhododendron molle]
MSPNSTEGNPHLSQPENFSKCQVDLCAKKKNFVVPAIASIASCLVVGVVSLAIWWSLKIRKRQDEMVKEGIRQFTHSELVTITNNFENELGKGGFGSVYAGHLTDGTQVAVKRLSPTSHQGSKEFQTEAKNPNILSWEKRLQIACDAARGLAYLHDGCKTPIIHRDIKTANILLTENMQAKVSDFGLSRLMPSDSGTHVSTVVAGTHGYLDPKYGASGKLKKKSDVYSFGVVLLELITGKPAVLETPENTLLVNWIEPMFKRAEIKEIMDLRLNSDFDTNSTRLALETAMACVECDLTRRLAMKKVVANLRECLEMEEARVKAWKENEGHNSASGNTVYVSGSSVGGTFAIEN